MNTKIELDFFADCKTKEEARKLFLKLCLQLHPDKGGEHNRFIRMQREYEYVQGLLPNETEKRETTQQKECSLSTMIELLCRLRGIEIELCGEWIWITGDTYNARSSLHEWGLKFSGKKRAWYWFDGIQDDENKKYRGKKSLSEIRSMYGSEKLENVSVNTQVKAV